MDASDGPRSEDDPYVYVSYAGIESSIAGLLFSALEGQGIRVRDGNTAPRSGALPVPAGHDAELRDAAAVLVVWSGLSDDSSEVRYDAAQADDRFVSVVLDGGESLPRTLQQRPVHDMAGWQGALDDARVDKLADDLKQVIARHSGAAFAQQPGPAGTDGPAPAPRLSPSAQAALEGSLSWAAGKPPGATEVLLSALKVATTHDGPSTGLLESLARRQNLTGLKLSVRLGERFPVQVLAPGEAPLADRMAAPALSVLLGRAASYAERVSGERYVRLRHLIAACMLADDPPLTPELLAELGMSATDLPREFLRVLMPYESSVRETAAWRAILQGSLAGGSSSDAVDPEEVTDDLDRGKWAEMFADLVAAEATDLPLSIGLFGAWGSGKSTFMGLLREQIDRLCGKPGYERDVAHIWFDAWHYADANLWASLGDAIFAELARVLTPEDKKPLTVLERVGKDQREQADLERQINERHLLTEVLTTRKKDAEKEVRAQAKQLAFQEREARDLRQETAKNLVKALAGSEAVDRKAKRGWELLGVSDEVEQGEMLADEFDGIGQESRALRGALGWRMTWVLAAVCLAVLLLTLASTALPDGSAALSAVGTWLRHYGAFSTVAAVLVTGTTVLGRVHYGLKLFRSAFTSASSAAHAKADTRVEAARDSFRAAQVRAKAADTELQRANTDLADLERQLAALAPGRQIYAFLAEKAESGDYASKLGLISVIRKDLKSLAEALKRHHERLNAEREKTGKEPVGRRIGKIVLYIDDLDRCQPRQVVEVLQAVHLLLALPLFVVVVGVDPRWLVRSLQDQYPGTLGAGPGGQPGGWLGEATPADYLEKIFNISFALPEFPGDLMGKMLRHLAAASDAALRGKDEKGPDEQAPGTSPAGTGEGDARVTPPGGAPESDTSGGDRDGTGRSASGPAGGDVQRVQSLTEDEFAFLGKLGAFIRTPRDAKRLFNLYRLLRFNAYRIADQGGDLPTTFLDGGYQAMAVLLAMLTLDAQVLREVLDAQASPEGPDRPGSGPAGGLAARPAGVNWSEFAADLIPQPDVQQAGVARPAWRNRVVGAIPAGQLHDWQRMSAAVQTTVSGNLVTVTGLKDFKDWAPYVRRFSYGLLSLDDPEPGDPRPEGRDGAVGGSRTRSG